MTYALLPTWGEAISELTFTQDALDAGRTRAIDVWNQMPTDIEVSPTTSPKTYKPTISSIAGSQGYMLTSMVEDAAYAFAVILEAARIDSLRMTTIVGGVTMDPAPNIVKALPAAMQATRAYVKWVAETKPKLTMGSSDLGI